MSSFNKYFWGLLTELQNPIIKGGDMLVATNKNTEGFLIRIPTPGIN